MHARSEIPSLLGQKSCRQAVSDHANIECIQVQILKKEKSHFSEFAFTTVMLLEFVLIWCELFLFLQGREVSGGG